MNDMRCYMNPPIPCYTCKHALKRGEFRECSVGGTGYKHIGMVVDCEKWEGEEKDDEHGKRNSSRDGS